MVKPTRNAGKSKARDTSREAGHMPAMPVEADSSGVEEMLHLSRRARGLRQKPGRFSGPEPTPVAGTSNYEARCMCGWVKWYKNPYQASLGSKYHAEIWCPLVSNAKGQGALDCYFCGERYEDFGPLAVHVQAVHFKREDYMINARRQAAPSGSGGVSGVQFLGLKHITSSGGHVAKIVRVTTDKPDNFGNPFVVYFTMGEDGTRYSKGFRETSPLLCDLVDFFGNDEKKWLGKQIVIRKVTDEEGSERLSFGRLPEGKK